jgi:hypothetical protein
MAKRVIVLPILVKTPKTFPESDKRSVPLVRLMAATNDTRLMQKQFLVTNNSTRRKENIAEKLVRMGEAGYFGRMFLAHLYESAEALGALDHVAKPWVTKAGAKTAKSKVALVKLRQAFVGGDKTKGLLGFLAWMRTKAAFHYKDQPFRDALGQTTRETHLLVAQYEGFSRYSLIDVLLDEVLKKAAKETGIDYKAAIGQAVALADHLATLVVRLLDEYTQERPTTWKRQAPRTLRVPRALPEGGHRQTRSARAPVQPLDQW